MCLDSGDAVSGAVESHGAAAGEPQGDVESLPFTSLRLDRENPRAGEAKFSTEQDAIRYLLVNADVAEIISSIRSSGWIDYEPLIVDRTTLVVYEGNRRLAALKLLDSSELRGAVGLSIGAQAVKLPQKVRVILVKSRNDARLFIGFKHINGPFKWDAAAKARFAADWLKDDGNIDKVSRALGDSHSTVLRMVNGWRVLMQAENSGFDRKSVSNPDNSFPFSHLYTALARPSTRSFLGLSDDPATLFLENPIDKDHISQLTELMSWIYGQKNEPAVVRSQNPHLNHLVKVLASDQGLRQLRETRVLSDAYDQVEPPSVKFREALRVALTHASKAQAAAAFYNPDTADDERTKAEALFKVARFIKNFIQEKDDGD